MAKFLKNHGITDAIEDLIRAAKTHLVLISPYWKLSDSFKRTLVAKPLINLDIQVVYRPDKSEPADIQWFKSQHIQTLGLEQLHTKCYLNEDHCIITSLNLYEFSQVHNAEMGILISRTDDGVLYDDVYKEVCFILSQRSTKPVATQTTTMQKQNEKSLAYILGFSSAPEFRKTLEQRGYLKLKNRSYELTDQGLLVGGEMVETKSGGHYRIWPVSLKL